MQPQTRSNTFAARMGRWSASHRKTAVFGWLGFVVLAFVIGAMAGTKNIDPDTSMPGESGRAERILKDDFAQPARESVLVESDELTAGNAAFRAAVTDVVRTLERSPLTTDVRSPLDGENAGQVSPDKHAALVQFEMRGDADAAADKVGRVEAAIAGVQERHPELYVAEFGDASADKALNEAFAKDLEKAGMLSLPITLGILLIAFGALVAAGIPLLLALSAVMATMGLLALPSHLMPIDENIGAVILLIGLAVGVDYTMFYLKREREERAAGRSAAAALEAAAATSGRAVLISGLTVMVAMAGMFLTGDPGFSSFALGTIMVVAIAVLGSLTVLPALLSKLGDNVERLRVPFIGGRGSGDGGGRMWGAILDRVLRRPLVSAVLAAGVLVALALPAVGMKTVMPGAEAYPRSMEVMQTYDRIQAAFPGEQIPATVVVRADDVDSPAMQEAVGQLEWRALTTGLMRDPITEDVNEGGTVLSISIPIVGSGSDEQSNAAVAALREDIVPDTVGAVDGTESGVTGMTAISQDFDHQMRATAPLVFGFVLLFAFVLLLVSFRSVVIAAKAIVLNLLSVGAAYGILVLVFQHGWGKGLLGFEYTGGVMAFMPVFLFVILFGLSMDYHVFILSRVREAFDRGMSTEDAVTYGIKSTAGVVTMAAVVMVFVFSVFGALSMIMLKQFGVGLAAAVLIDATIVRAVLLPATMKLLGDWNWYLPRWLEWLPSLEPGEPAEPAEPAGDATPATA
jgi:uncharacterized membrane protein YdfJ with MMPL/SSD domain